MTVSSSTAAPRRGRAAGRVSPSPPPIGPRNHRRTSDDHDSSSNNNNVDDSIARLVQLDSRNMAAPAAAAVVATSVSRGGEHRQPPAGPPPPHHPTDLPHSTADASHNSDYRQGHGHFFTKKNFHRPTHCHHCMEMVWGLLGQGYVCEGSYAFLIIINCLLSLVGGKKKKKTHRLISPRFGDDGRRRGAYASCVLPTVVTRTWSVPKIDAIPRYECNLASFPSIAVFICPLFAHRSFDNFEAKRRHFNKTELGDSYCRYSLPDWGCRWLFINTRDGVGSLALVSLDGRLSTDFPPRFPSATLPSSGSSNKACNNYLTSPRMFCTSHTCNQTFRGLPYAYAVHFPCPLLLPLRIFGINNLQMIFPMLFLSSQNQRNDQYW